MEVPAIGVVGMGGYAQAHRRYVERVERGGLGRQVAQVAIPTDQQVFAAELAALEARGVAVYASLRQMLAAARDQLDVVCIPTGIPLHRLMTTMALDAGCHVLVEKPAAGCIQDVDAMLAAQDRSGRLCAVGYQHLYRADVQQVKEWVCQGRLGRVRSIKACGCWPRTPDYYARNGWAGRLAVGDAWVLDSPHNNALAHAINAMCYLGCDRPGEALVPATVQAELYRANAIESADTAVLRVRSREGVELFFAVSHCTDRQVDPTFLLEAELGRLELEYHGGFRVQWADGRQESRPATAEPGVLEDLVEVVAGRRERLACPLAVTRSQTLCVCGTFESSAIHEIPQERRGVDPASGGVVVRGMTDTVLRACEGMALFSELGVDWAQPGASIELGGYGYFPTHRPHVG
jgi:predicted dehydrogenase